MAERQRIVCPYFARNASCKISASVQKSCGRHRCALELRDVAVVFEGAR
jgi:hypothetical protein